MKFLRQIKNLKNKRALVRVDFNVALGVDGRVEPTEALGRSPTGEAFKIEAVLPTIKYLLEKKAKIILMSHLGRPGGKARSSLRIDPVADYLSEVLKKLVKKEPGVTGAEVEKEVAKLKAGEILMLENLRFAKGEEENDPRFAKELARLGDIYVNDAFSVSHRPAASVSAITKFLPAYAGFLLETEIKALSRIIQKPKKPFLVLMGGLKFETKLLVIEKLLPKVDKILLGGGLASTCLKAMGYGVGDSLVDNDYLSLAKKISQEKKILLPIDVIVGSKNKPCDFYHLPIPVKPMILCPSPYAIYDVGPATIQAWAKLIKKANTLVWNGPLGNFEQRPYDFGTLAMARLIAGRAKGKAFAVVGGGETIAALRQSKMAEFVDHVSTGGGAMLEFLAGKKLPGLEALK